MPLGASAMLDAFCCRKQRDGEWMCSRVGSDRDISMCIYGFGISIHAPAWGATRGRVAIHAGKKISIHAPAWGATE